VPEPDRTLRQQAFVSQCSEAWPGPNLGIVVNLLNVFVTLTFAASVVRRSVLLNHFSVEFRTREEALAARRGESDHDDEP
jgi:hypothetical protein